MFIFFFVNFWDCACVYMKYLWWRIFLHIIKNWGTMFFRVKFVSFIWLPAGHNTVCSSQAYRYSDFTDLEKAHLSPLHLGTTELHVECGFFFSFIAKILKWRKWKKYLAIITILLPSHKIVILDSWDKKGCF